MVWGTFQGYKNGLGAATSDSWTPDWTVIGTIPNSSVVLLQSPVPEGVGFAIVEGQGTPAEVRLFPTKTRPSSTGTAGYTLSPDEAFGVFQELTVERNRLVSGSSDNMPQTFAELDAVLMADTHLPEDLTFELQKKGKAPDGGIKLALKLNTSRTSGLPFIGNSEDFALAKMYYASYEQSVRIRALEDCDINIISRYLDPTVVSQIISRNRLLVQTYRKMRASGNATGISLESFMTKAGGEDAPVLELMPTEPLFAISVKFEDQTGKEVKQLPYRISVRGIVNFDEARQQTAMGANPGQFGSGQTLFQEGVTGDITLEQPGRENWTGQSLGSELYHFLYAYKATGEEKNGRFPWPRGNVKISISPPERTDGDWENSRLSVYNKPASRSVRRDGKLTRAAPLQILWSENIRIEEGAFTRLKIVIPVHMEPLPMHLIEDPPESGNLRLRWEVEPDRSMIPSHQKVNMQFKVMRPQANDLWEAADKMPTTSRAGYDDKILQYDEFVSDAGRAASKAGVVGSRPVRGMRFLILPKEENTWAAAKEHFIVESDSISGSFNVEVCPGEYELIRLQDINGDGTPALEEGDGILALPFHKLPATTRKFLTDANNGEPPSGKSFQPKQYPVARFRAPGGFYYRKTDERDTTPIGVVGAEMLPRVDVGTGQFLRMTNFELNGMFPPLPADKDPVTDTIYATLALAYPECETQGWPIPGQSTKTSQKLFDTANIVLMDESTVDISRVGEYERRYEAERDGTSVLTPAPSIPRVGQAVSYKGYYIERAFFDTGYGVKPSQSSSEIVIPRRKGQSFEMGKLASGYTAPGVVEIMAYYPINGQLERAIIMPETIMDSKGVEVNPIFSLPAEFMPSTSNIEKILASKLQGYRQMTLPMASNMEAGILSGRFIVLQNLGQGMSIATPEGAYEKITEAIDKGGAPIPGMNHQQYWGATEDWFFKRGKPIAIGNGDPTKLDPTQLKPDRIINSGLTDMRDMKNQGSAKELTNDQKNKAKKMQSERVMMPVRGSLGSTVFNLENENGDDDILFLPIQQDEDEEVYYE